MSVRDNFTPDEWKKVLQGPGHAGVAVIASSPSGITGLLAEASAMAQVIRELTQSPPPSPLLQDVAQAYQQEPGDEDRRAREQDNDRARSPDEVKARALENLRQTLWLVSTKSGPDDVAAYKELIVRVAERVAGAAKEGGFLGMGGVQVSDAETATIREIRHLLGL